LRRFSVVIESANHQRQCEEDNVHGAKKQPRSRIASVAADDTFAVKDH
jgi:hypothetical protein